MFKRAALRKIILFLIFFPIAAARLAWGADTFFQEHDTAEVDRYYDLLLKNAKQPQTLVLTLGIKDGEDLQMITNRLKKTMGLEQYEIWIGHHDDTEKPLAEIKNMGYGIMGISIYSGITEKREEISLLVHELGHIYVWDLDEAILKGCDEEKVVDTSGIFLGLGILILNGLTDETSFVPGGEYESKKKFLGYLYPSEFGYLLARYVREYGIPKSNITLFLNPTGREYFESGYNYLERQRLAAKSGGESGRSSVKNAGEAAGIYWCPSCGNAGSISLSGEIKDLKCPNCGRSLT